MIASALITFREALEAALIITILTGYLRKIGRRDLSKHLYRGTIGAIVLSLLLGWGIIELYGSLPPNAERLFEGAASITATAVLTYMILWMSKNAHTLRGDLQKKLDVAVTTDHVIGITAVAFISVFREGLESVLFLATLAVTDPLGTLVGTLLGIGIVFLVALLLVKGIYRLDLRRFFTYTSVILIVFAAGMAGYGVHELIEAGVLPAILQPAWDINPADIAHPLHENGSIGSIFKTVLGYDGNPELLRVLVYLGYWLTIGLYLLRRYTRPNREPMHDDHRNEVTEEETIKPGIPSKAFRTGEGARQHSEDAGAKSISCWRRRSGFTPNSEEGCPRGSGEA